MVARKPFGGMTVSFAKCDCSMKDVMGSSAMGPSDMTKKIWKHVKSAHGGLMKK